MNETRRYSVQAASDVLAEVLAAEKRELQDNPGDPGLLESIAYLSDAVRFCNRVVNYQREPDTGGG